MSQSSTQQPRRIPDAPAPGRHVPVVPDRGDQRAAQASQPELIVAPPAAAAPRADTAPASAEPAPVSPAPVSPAQVAPVQVAPAPDPGTETELSVSEQPRETRETRETRQHEPSVPLGTHSPPVPPAPPRQQLQHPASVVDRGNVAPDEDGRARYQSALDPMHPAPLIPAPQRRDAPVAPQARRYQSAADGLVTERVPVGLASAFFALHGADVSDVPVRRGRAVSQQATRLDAAAFSHGGEVYLPESVGSLGQAQAQALLAHELTHAVQQRMLGAALPGEDSAEGRELEEQAIATQRWFLGQPGPVPSLAFLPSGTVPRLTHAPVLQHAPRAASDEAVGTVGAGAPAALGSAGGGVQRQTTDAPVLTNPYAGPTSQSAQAAPAAAGAPPATSVPDAVAGTAVAAGMHPEIADLRDQVANLAGQRSADLDDPVHMDELAAKLYGRLRSKLRLELIVDRERSGLLTDFR